MSDRLALIIEGLCGVVARRVGPGIGLGGIAGPLIVLIWSRLRRIAFRFTRTMAAPPPSRPQAAPQIAPATLAARAAKRRTRRPNPIPPLLPRRKAWLLRLAPETASGASQLRHFLADPEVAACLAANPQLSRILRPLCFALGIRAAGIRAAGIRSAKAAPPDAAPAPPSAPIRCPPDQTAPRRTSAPAAHPPWTTPPPPDPAPAAPA